MFPSSYGSVSSQGRIDSADVGDKRLFSNHTLDVMNVGFYVQIVNPVSDLFGNLTSKNPKMAETTHAAIDFSGPALKCVSIEDPILSILIETRSCGEPVLATVR